MSRKSVDETVTELVLPIVQKRRFELVDVEFIKEGSNWYLRIYIDKPGGITIDDCKTVSEEIDARFDGIDLIKQSYFLEVSSPGERPLKKDADFERYKGELIEVKVYQPIEGNKVFEGILTGFINGLIVIKLENGKTLEFEKDKVAVVRRVIKL